MACKAKNGMFKCSHKDQSKYEYGKERGKRLGIKKSHKTETISTWCDDVKLCENTRLCDNPQRTIQFNPTLCSIICVFSFFTLSLLFFLSAHNDDQNQ